MATTVRNNGFSHFNVGNEASFRINNYDGYRYARVLLILLATEASTLLRHDIDKEWSNFKLTYNRTYFSRAEEDFRYTVFTKSLQMVHEHNMAADKGHHSFWLGINHLADMTDGEFVTLMTGLSYDSRNTKDFSLANEEVSNEFNTTFLPKEVDWRSRKCVTPVKYQGHCGSCYAFATTGALESHHCLKTGKLISLSEQNIIDCTDNKRYLNKGCKGGLMDHGYQYVIDNGGLDSEKSYPYEGQVGKCKFNKNTIGATEISYKDILPRGDERELKRAVGGYGPVSVGVDARGILFRLYSRGVYDNFMCSSTKLNHGMLVVGYGKTEENTDYWLIKNSWSTLWGMNGYMKMIRGRGNRCGIATLASYPIV